MTSDLSRKEVAEILNLSAQTIDNYRKKGLLKAIRYGVKGQWRYSIQDVLQLKKGHD